jgi:nucleoid DNA-binding protein
VFNEEKTRNMSTVYSRKDSVAMLVKKHEISKVQAEAIVQDLFADWGKALKKGSRLQLHPFGSFEVARLKARKGHNPKTGESIKIPARKRVKFKAYSGLKETVG